MSDDDLNELMDVDFPCGASSSSSSTGSSTSSNAAGASSSAPLIDLTVVGWDNDAISRCFSLSMKYNMHEYSQVQEGVDRDRGVFKMFEAVPNKLLNAGTGLVKDINVDADSNINMPPSHQHHHNDCNNINSQQDSSDDGACISSVNGTAQENNCHEGRDTSGEALQLQPVGLVLPNWAL